MQRLPIHLNPRPFHLNNLPRRSPQKLLQFRRPRLAKLRRRPPPQSRIHPFRVNILRHRQSVPSDPARPPPPRPYIMNTRILNPPRPPVNRRRPAPML